MTLDQIIREVQTAVEVKADGKPGPHTWTAIYDRLCAHEAVTESIVTTAVDPRSEAVIATLHPRVRTYARSFVQRAAVAGITLKIISGLRTYEDQDALYAKGRTQDGSIVTKARGGYSNHNFGLAFDIGIFDGAKYLADSPRYKAAAAIGLDLGLEWGGNWKSIQDEPHYQLRPAWAAGMSESVMLAELRRRKDSARDFFA